MSIDEGLPGLDADLPVGAESLGVHGAGRPRLFRPVSRPRPLSSEAPEAAPDPWRLLVPSDSVVLDRRTLRDARRLPPGTSVVVLGHGVLARARLRRAAHRAGVTTDRELIVLPAIRSPLVVLDDDDASIAVFWTAVAMVPPGLTRALAPATLLLRAMTLAPAHLTRQLAPGRILIGHTT